MQKEASFLVPARVKVLVLQEAAHIQGFMQLLMKPRNGLPWSTEDRTALRAHLKRLARKLPALALFTLPAGSLLLAALAYFLDRRRGRRLSPLRGPQERD